MPRSHSGNHIPRFVQSQSRSATAVAFTPFLSAAAHGRRREALLHSRSSFADNFLFVDKPPTEKIGHDGPGRAPEIPRRTLRTYSVSMVMDIMFVLMGSLSPMSQVGVAMPSNPGCASLRSATPRHSSP
jgi:hypothetical protein